MALQYFCEVTSTLTVISQRIWTEIIVKIINDNVYTTCYMLRQRINMLRQRIKD